MDEKGFREHVTVDLTGCEYVMEFWNRIKDALDFQDHFGKSRDAFWDMLKWEYPAHIGVAIF